MPLPHDEPLDNAIGRVAKDTQQHVDSGGEEGHDRNGAARHLGPV